MLLYLLGSRIQRARRLYARSRGLKHTDDCKPVDSGRSILATASTGAAVLIDRETGHVSFRARMPKRFRLTWVVDTVHVNTFDAISDRISGFRPHPLNNYYLTPELSAKRAKRCRRPPDGGTSGNVILF